MRRRIVVSLCLLGIGFAAVGCGYVPGLSDIGLLPGPPPSLILQNAPDEALTQALSQFGDIGTRPCPEGQIWVGTVGTGGRSITLNRCVDKETAGNAAEAFGLL